MDLEFEIGLEDDEISASEFLSRSLNHELLGERQEKELLERAQSGDRGAVDTLVECNQRLVSTLAQRYFRHNETNEIEYCDLVQAGNIGLLKAIKIWDASKNTRFGTHAYWWIRAYISRFAAHRATALSVSYHFSEKLITLRRVRSRLMKVLPHDPTVEELARETGFTREEVETGLMAILKTVSLHDAEHGNASDEDESEIMEYCIPDLSQNTEEDALSKVLAFQVVSMVGQLPAKWRSVIIERFGLNGSAPKTTTEIAESMGVSRQAIATIEKRALRYIRANVIFTAH